MIENLSISLPIGCIIRQATASDIRSIRKMVLRAKLDPTQLRWQQFWIVECENNVVACAQLREFSQAQELGSLVVLPAWRGRGLGTYLTQHLVAQATKPLYLECLGDRLAQFYVRFGFHPIAWTELPRSLQFKFGISQLARILLRIPVVMMQYREKGEDWGDKGDKGEGGDEGDKGDGGEENYSIKCSPFPIPYSPLVKG